MGETVLDMVFWCLGQPSGVTEQFGRKGRCSFNPAVHEHTQRTGLFRHSPDRNEGIAAIELRNLEAKRLLADAKEDLERTQQLVCPPPMPRAPLSSLCGSAFVFRVNTRVSFVPWDAMWRFNK